MENEKARYSISQITQGNHKFYTLTVPSPVLARCCYATSREEDPMQGFQRVLDRKRAEEIAKYIDSGLGTIPSSIVLSAQEESDFKIIGKGKTAEFSINPKSFLILDGQHRIFGFALSNSEMRVPVVIYNGLTRRDETRLFIDINSKQKGVPNELLLDIKSLAEYENDHEQILREIFDRLNTDITSKLYDMLSPSTRSKNKLTRVTFNNAVKPLLPIFEGKSLDETYQTFSAYIAALTECLERIDCGPAITNSTVFKGIIAFFPTVASKVKDKFGPIYTLDNFYEVLDSVFDGISVSKFKKPGNSYSELTTYLENRTKSSFVL